MSDNPETPDNLDPFGAQPPQPSQPSEIPVPPTFGSFPDPFETKPASEPSSEDSASRADFAGIFPPPSGAHEPIPDPFGPKGDEPPAFVDTGAPVVNIPPAPAQKPPAAGMTAKNRNWIIIAVIAVLLLCCCCLVLIIALFALNASALQEMNFSGILQQLVLF